MVDYAALWIRGFNQPQWQADFIEELHRRGVLGTPEQQQLWDMEVLLASSGNLNYLHWSKIEDDAVRAEAAASLQRNIENILGLAR
jgi:hypothetical protein